MSSCELNLGDQYMYVYEDSNFVAHKWLEHQALGKSLPVSNFPCYYKRCYVEIFIKEWTFFGHFSSASR